MKVRKSANKVYLAILEVSHLNLTLDICLPLLQVDN